MKTQVLTPGNFNQTVTGTNQPVLVDFWAEWCGPCKMIAPVIEELANEQSGHAIVAKLNIDEAPEIAAEYGITAIPTLIVFKDGKPYRTLRGVQSKTALASALAAARNN